MAGIVILTGCLLFLDGGSGAFAIWYAFGLTSSSRSSSTEKLSVGTTFFGAGSPEKNHHNLNKCNNFSFYWTQISKLCHGNLTSNPGFMIQWNVHFYSVNFISGDWLKTVGSQNLNMKHWSWKIKKKINNL